MIWYELLDICSSLLDRDGYMISTNRRSSLAQEKKPKRFSSSRLISPPPLHKYYYSFNEDIPFPLSRLIITLSSFYPLSKASLLLLLKKILPPFPSFPLMTVYHAHIVPTPNRSNPSIAPYYLPKKKKQPGLFSKPKKHRFWSGS